MEVRYVTDRHDTLCAKYRQEYRDNPDYLYCGVADMDLAPPDPVLEAMKRRLDHGVFGYTELPDGYEKLVSDWMRERYHCEVIFESRHSEPKSDQETCRETDREV